MSTGDLMYQEIVSTSFLSSSFSSMDVASNFCLLHAKLSKLGFNGWTSVNEGDVMTGNPHTFALFLRFLYHRFPTSTATLLRRYDWFLVEAEDVALGGTTVRVLSLVSRNVKWITATQFAQCKYAMIKVNMCHALLQFLRSLATPSSGAPSTTATRSLPMCPQGKAIISNGVLAAPLTSATESSVSRKITERRRELNSLPRS